MNASAAGETTKARSSEIANTPTRKFYLVGDSSLPTERPVWIATFIDGRAWVYVANTGRWHQHDELTRDRYSRRRDMTYEPIDASRVRDKTACGVIGLIDRRLSDDVHREFARDQHSVTTDEILSP